MVHNRKTAKFWTDSWLYGSAPAMMFPRLYQHSRRKPRTVTYAMSNENWIGDVMHGLSPSLIAEYIMLWIMVDSIVYDPEDGMEDEIRWCRTAMGDYTSKSAYEIQFHGELNSSFPMMM
jgi:hypothetical protein